MCSWCWGYKPVWNEIERALEPDIDVIYVLGGLAPDSDVPMPEAMQQQIASYWKKIETFLGTTFNYDFWSKNTPRRSTYPACRALIAARAQQAEKPMLEAIQHAYYLNAQNPSDDDILINLAQTIGIDVVKFKQDYLSPDTHQALLDEIEFARRIGAQGFPSLVLNCSGRVIGVPVNYQDAQATIDSIRGRA
jgi:putative protein-disulfide isomerase